MIWKVATSNRFRDSRAEILTWTFDSLVAGLELIEAYEKGEASAQEIARKQREEGSPDGT